MWVLILLLTGLVSCNLGSQKYYTVEKQFKLANDRAEKMTNQLDFSVTFDKNPVKHGERIYFGATFTNVSNAPIVFRKPKQNGVLEIAHANTTLLFSISPIRGEKSFWYPNEYLGYELAASPIHADEYISLNPNIPFQVRLELPKMGYLKQNDIVDQSELPAGEYILNMKYQNHYIGNEIEQNGKVVYLDMNAWVGEVESKPVLLTILP